MDATKIVAANRDCLQGKLKFNTRRKMVNGENGTGRFVSKGTKNEGKEKIIASGATGQQEELDTQRIQTRTPTTNPSDKGAVTQQPGR